jgi:glycosyltransferase involved in cell wall biosynthesis
MTRVIYDGISPLPDYSKNIVTCFRNELGMGNNRPLLAVVGSISELKAQIIAVQAMPEILSKFPDARLLIVGEANDRLGELYKQKLISSIEGLGLQNYVTLTGFRNDIPLLMSSIDLLIHVPVLPEALGRVILEASLQGALVIGSDIGGINEIIIDGETGRLVQPGNPSQVAGSVIDLLSSPVKAEQMRRASVIRVKQKFNCDTYVNQIQSVYEELL